jgi:hypothetical protein
MTPQEAKLAREKLAEPFLPQQEGGIELHSIHALNYIAYYLGEIDQKMERIAHTLERMQANSVSSTESLKLIQKTLVRRKE